MNSSPPAVEIMRLSLALHRPSNRWVDPLALKVALGCVALLAGSIFIGSGALKFYDRALTHYMLGSMLTLFAVAYRLSIWFQRPPTRLLFRRAAINVFRGIAAKRRFASNVVIPVSRGLSVDFAAQNFIRRRGWARWGAHACLSWGSTISFAFTFPLVFGWVHFETAPGAMEIYDVYLLGFRVDAFSIHSLKAFIAFNLLNLSAVLVLVGVALATIRRLTDKGERATQTFSEDWLPLILLFSVASSGLALTASSRGFGGRGYAFLAAVHAAVVITFLLHIPFGKLLHIFQRIAALAVAINKKAAAAGIHAHCVTCREPFAPVAQIEDLSAALRAVGLQFSYGSPAGEVSYQRVCPRCRRRMLALNQGRALGR